MEKGQANTEESTQEPHLRCIWTADLGTFQGVPRGGLACRRGLGDSRVPCQDPRKPCLQDCGARGSHALAAPTDTL